MHVIAMLAQAQETSTVYMLYWYVPLGLRPEGSIESSNLPEFGLPLAKMKILWGKGTHGKFE